MSEEKFTLKDIILVSLCLLPLWLFEYQNYLNINFWFIFLLLTIVTCSFLFLLNYKNKFITLYYFIYSTILFYGIDSKIGFFTFVDKLLKSGLIKYLLPTFFLFFTVYLIYQLLIRSSKTKNIFLFVLISLFLVNLLPLKLFTYNNYEIENIKIDYATKVSEKKKLIILHLDEMVGYDGIDTNISYGAEAKKSYYDLFFKYQFNLYSSAYSIYNNTIDSIPNLLNFDFNTKINNSSNYYDWNNFDKKSKWKVNENKFFENNKNKKIIATKEQSGNFCNKWVKSCLYSNPENNYKKYIKSFKFSEFDYFVKQTHNQRSLLFQYIWKLGLERKLFNDYHFLTFYKVKFENDLENFSKLINKTDFDIYFAHFIFPHRPFIFDLNVDLKKCTFNSKYTSDKYYKNRKDMLTQHYKEIICTNYYLDNFLNSLTNNFNSDNLELLILTDTGTKTPNFENNSENEEYQKYLRDNYSVLFAIKQKNSVFEINEEFVSSQELFSRFFNNEHGKIELSKNKRIHDDVTNTYKSVSNFLAN